MKLADIVDWHVYRAARCAAKFDHFPLVARRRCSATSRQWVDEVDELVQAMPSSSTLTVQLGVDGDVSRLEISMDQVVLRELPDDSGVLVEDSQLVVWRDWCVGQGIVEVRAGHVREGDPRLVGIDVEAQNPSEQL